MSNGGTLGAIVALTVAVIAQTGLVVTQILSKRKPREDRAQSSLDFMQDVAEGLRAEIDRERSENDRLRTEVSAARAEARAARIEARDAHATAGTLYSRVELLERLMRRAGVPFPPRRDDGDDTGQTPVVPRGG